MQSELCDLEQVTLKPPQLQAHHCLTTWLQIWYHSLLSGDRRLSIRKDADLEPRDLSDDAFKLDISSRFLPMEKLSWILDIQRRETFDCSGSRI